jgi:hypothetical protein
MKFRSVTISEKPANIGQKTSGKLKVSPWIEEPPEKFRLLSALSKIIQDIKWITRTQTKQPSVLNKA